MTEKNRARVRASFRVRYTRDALLLLMLTATSVLLHGYHYGHQDAAVWLPSIKKLLDPGLYPYDSIFFLAQAKLTLFDDLVAFSVKVTHLPLDLGVFLWHLLAIFLVLLGCLKLARRCFAAPGAQWAAVTTVWAARLLPIAGTKLNLMDRYLHPRDLATGALLLALVAVLDGRLTALLWVALAGLVHPTMALFGAFHLAVQAWKLPRPLVPMLLATPFWGGFFWPVPNEAWREVLATRAFLFPLRWHWHEWLNLAGTLIALGWLARVARSSGTGRVKRVVAHLGRRAVLAAMLGVAGSLLITTVPALERFIPTEPMRTLHLVYLLFVFLGGGLLGEHVLRDRPGRWLVFLLPICLAFFVSNRLFYPSSPHIEWPGRVPPNAWVEAFDWARQNTPRQALFALDPMHMNRPGEDSHGFRAFAERSMLADGVKDRAVAANVPELACVWREQVRDLEPWRDFGLEDFRRLRKKYGVAWVVLERGNTRVPPGVAGLPCPFANQAVRVCQVE